MVIAIGIAVGLLASRERQGFTAADYEPPPAGMVLVPGGEFVMGSDEPMAEPDERPRRHQFVRAFYIDRFEVTNRRYREFKPAHRFPAGEEEFPVTHVLKAEAEAYCRWASRRLPTDAEWERAARGTDGRTYPWGTEFETSRANIRDSSGRPLTNGTACKMDDALRPSSGKRRVGSFPLGASPAGCEDMAGNVWEWVSDEWSDPRPWFYMGVASEPRGILRGGAYNYSPLQARTSYHGFEHLDATCHDVGFRCAMDAVPKLKK